jgi:hypothetical protein
VPGDFLPVSERFLVDAEQVAKQCVEETKTASMSKHAMTAALAGLAACDGDERPLKRAIRAAYVEEHRPGFVFTMIVLPLLISLVSQWIIRWWFDNKETRAYIGMEAERSLSASSRFAISKAKAMST